MSEALFPSVAFGQLDFQEQIDFFRRKMNLPTSSWRDVWQAAHDRAFVVAGAMQADLLQDLRKAVDAAITKGETLEDFRARFDTIIAQTGWSYTGGRNWRTRVIYQTNMATSYSAGRLVQLKEAADNGLLWMYKHLDGVSNPRPLHVSWDGLTLPADDIWWKNHYPPNGWGCHCYVVGVRPERVTRMGGRLGPAPDDGINPLTGAPEGIDEGWDYMPGAGVDLGLRQMVQDKLITYPPAMRAALGRDINGAIALEVPVAEFVAQSLAEPERKTPLFLGFVENDTEILNATGLDTRGYYVALNPDQIRHIENAHQWDGKKQRAPEPKDFTYVTQALKAGEVSKGKRVDGVDNISVKWRSPSGEVYVMVFRYLTGKRNRMLQLWTMSIKT